MMSSPDNGDKRGLCPETPVLWMGVYAQVGSGCHI